MYAQNDQDGTSAVMLRLLASAQVAGSLLATSRLTRRTGASSARAAIVAD